MHIIRFEAENVKKIKAVRIIPKGNIISVTGKNEVGKSSVLDSIVYALGGGEALKKLKKPIRDGADKAKILLDLGDYIVRRWWTSNENTYLEVSTKDGAVFKSAQTILDGLIGNLSFDPAAYANMKEDKQREILLGLVKLDIDLDKWKKDRDQLYEERKLVNREVKRLDAQIQSKPTLPPEIPDEDISIVDILAEMIKAQKEIDDNSEARRKVTDRANELANMKGVIDKHEAQLAMFLQKVEDTRKEIARTTFERNQFLEKHQELTAAANALVDPDLKAFQAKIEAAEKVNKNIAAKKELEGLLQQENEKALEADKLTEKIEAMDAAKKNALLKVTFPIDGLGFDEDGVVYRGIPFSQCSSEERLRVSLAMAMAMNPKLKVLRVTDGSLIDEKHLQIITEMCEDKDYQLFIERIAEGPTKGSIYIYDGEVVSDGETTETVEDFE